MYLWWTNRVLTKQMKTTHLRITILAMALLTLQSCGIYRSATLPQYNMVGSVRHFGHLSTHQIDSLMAEYGKNKVFIDKYLEPTLIALSFYPELKEEHIEFRYSKEATTMAARPDPLSVLGHRRYIILVNNDPGFRGIPPDSVPFNAQIGLIGHELAHIEEYSKQNILGVLSTLFRYADKHRRPLFEQETDLRTIHRGLGWQLYDWATYAMYTNHLCDERYKEFKRKNYMTPEQIKFYIEACSRYCGTREQDLLPCGR